MCTTPIIRWACGHVGQGVCKECPSNPNCIRPTLSYKVAHKCNFCEEKNLYQPVANFPNGFSAVDQHLSQVLTSLAQAKCEGSSSRGIDIVLMKLVSDAHKAVLLAAFRLPPARDVAVYSDYEVDSDTEVDFETRVEPETEDNDWPSQDIFGLHTELTSQTENSGMPSQDIPELKAEVDPETEDNNLSSQDKLEIEVELASRTEAVYELEDISFSGQEIIEIEISETEVNFEPEDIDLSSQNILDPEVEVEDISKFF